MLTRPSQIWPKYWQILTSRETVVSNLLKDPMSASTMCALSGVSLKNPHAGRMDRPGS